MMVYISYKYAKITANVGITVADKHVPDAAAISDDSATGNAICNAIVVKQD